MQQIRRLGFALFIILSAISAEAAITRDVAAVDELVAAQRVLRATVMSVDAEWIRDQNGNSHIESTYHLSVQATLKGTHEPQVDIRVRGGTAGDITEWVEHSHVFTPGTEAIFLLDESMRRPFLQLRRVLAIENEKVSIDGTDVDVEKLRGALKEGARIRGAIEEIMAGPAPSSSDFRVVTAADVRNVAKPLNPIEISLPQATDGILSTPDGEKTATQKKSNSGGVSTQAVTTTIYDATWSNAVDSDSDGYVRSARLTWDADVVGSTGSLSVYFKLYYKLSSSSSWTLLNTSSSFTITGNSSTDTVFIDITGGGHNLYDWRIEVYRTGLTTADAARDATTDADLNDYRMETPAEDVAVSATATIFNAWWTDTVDSDGDGYVQSARLNFDADVVGSTGSLMVFFRLYYRLGSASSWTLLSTSGNFTISGNSSADAINTVITGGGHNLYDWRIEVYRSGQGSPDYARDPSNDSDLNDYRMETPAEDATSGGTPSISSISPSRASAGTQTSVTISGSGFGASQGTGKVEFFFQAGSPKITAPIVSWSASQLIAQVPIGFVQGYPGSAGSGPVTVTTSGGTSNGVDVLVPFGYGGSRWPGTNPVITFRIDPNFSQAQRDAIRRSFLSWNLAAGVLFSHGGNTQNGHDISDDGETQIIYGPSTTYCGTTQTNIIGCANCFIQGGATLRDCDLVLNSDFRWSTGTPTPNTTPSTFDIETIVLHEVGHWLMLRDLYGNADSAKTMYGSNNGGSSWMKRIPGSDDAEGGRWIYGSPVAMASISTATATPSSLRANETFTIQYTASSLVAAKYLVGASLRPAGTTPWTISDAAHDVSVELPVGGSSRNRTFTVPAGTSVGSYDLGLALWSDRNGNGLIDAGDQQVVLKTVAGAVQIVNSTTTCTSFFLSSNSANPGSGSGSTNVTITGSPSGCVGGTWFASGNGSWLTVSAASGSGSGPITIFWTQNTQTPSRSGNALIAGNSFTVTQAGSSSSTSVRGDFNGDGNVDVIWRHDTTGQNVAWLMSNRTQIGSGYFGNLPDAAWKMVGAADFNSDGRTDLLWRNSTNGQNVVWYLNGTTMTGAGYMPSLTDMNWTIEGVGDFTGDGRPDLIWHNHANGQVVLWIMNGVAQVGWAGVATVTDLNWHPALAADFNADGQTDLFWRNRSTGANVFWSMNGVAQTGGFYLSSLATAWKPAAVGDYDGDGRPDLFWHNTSTGQTAIWFINNFGNPSGQTLGTVSDLGWKVVGPR
ncbi:MAG TPA: choice-of-anchor H family protein [Thermoanaerobaculia bacterium]|jgi:hypothetical protein|nr:choice-of-anchor H family protein [Thermoanaerobaculia bacterium]